MDWEKARSEEERVELNFFYRKMVFITIIIVT
jgi:hypothetical protein